MSTLKRDDILKVQDIKIEKISVPEWGGDVYVKGMTGTERDAFEGSIVSANGKNTSVNMVNIRAKLAAQSICDEGGTRLFDDKDIKVLGAKSATALQRIFEVAQRLSGIGDEAMQELAGGLRENPLGDSPTD